MQTSRVGAVALVTALVACACTPQVASDPVPETSPFDPAATPALVPQPTMLVVDLATSRIDLSLAGVEVPTDCSQPGALGQAQCEFYQYLEQLDGFPTDMAATAPVTAAINSGSLTASNLVVIDETSSKSVEGLVATYDGIGRQLSVIAAGGWELGKRYTVGVRGYSSGIHSIEGRPFVAAVPYFMLKQESSLTCGASSAALLPPDCPWAALLAGPGQTQEMVFGSLSELEGVRQLYGVQWKLWEHLAQRGLPKDEVLAAWTFPTHTRSVIELNPGIGRLPKVVSSTKLELTHKGTIAAATLRPFSMLSPGSVFLLNLTALEKNDFKLGIPRFTASLGQGVVALDAKEPLIDGNDYCIMVTNAVTDEGGRALVAPPLTVLLRSRGKLTTEQGKSAVEGVTDADATQLEEGRAMLQTLLDDASFKDLTKLSREDLVYLYAFKYPNP